MAGDPTHAKRSGIVYLAAQPLLTLCPDVHAGVAEIIHLASSFLSWRDARFESGIGTKAGIAHAQRRKNILARELVKHLAADTMHDFTESNVVDIAINKARARLTAQRLAIQTLHRFIVTSPTIAQIKIRSKAGHVSQQLLDRDRVAAVAFHLRNEFYDRIA